VVFDEQTPGPGGPLPEGHLRSRSPGCAGGSAARPRGTVDVPGNGVDRRVLSRHADAVAGGAPGLPRKVIVAALLLAGLALPLTRGRRTTSFLEDRPPMAVGRFARRPQAFGRLREAPRRELALEHRASAAPAVQRGPGPRDAAAGLPRSIRTIRARRRRSRSEEAQAELGRSATSWRCSSGSPARPAGRRARPPGACRTCRACRAARARVAPIVASQPAPAEQATPVYRRGGCGPSSRRGGGRLATTIACGLEPAWSNVPRSARALHASSMVRRGA